MTTILVYIHHPEFSLWNFPDSLAARWRSHFEGRARIQVAPVEVPFEEGLGYAEVVIGRLDRDSFPRARRLRWIQAPSAGVGGLLFPELVESPVVVTNARGVHAVPMAEHALATMLGLTRKIHRARDCQRERRWGQEELWREEPLIDELNGKTLGIVGLGAIGTALASRARSLEMRVIAVRRRPEMASPDFVEEVRGEDELPWLLGESDFVVSCLPHTRRTERLFGEEAFARMKPGAFFLNLGRGDTVEESALARALEAGRLGGAGLDVTEEEPLPAASPLYGLSNLLLTPHVAGASRRFWERAGSLFEENIERFLDGRSLLNVVDKREGY